ncbi:MAG: porphyrinogen peroxidase [Pseudonocardiales bacterium]|jgi:putative iron-dependent peroxidase|uniref:Dyp-type peroxidase n=1 Tax=Pseudonocardia sp. TaxID=60912 RepID=UPI00260C2B25|nr:Dyp-type peroxidase [Pseudonocardia sp.]MCW2719746.1 Dyp-type peroxidase family [Pseudonocardia sp.]MDT7616199.1 porphyrinogen peroxidase [Pseudonocardiales bacterium]MDT7707642.1 porphyrinogen peroxidase [Pseudonocardiales bacterium]
MPDDPQPQAVLTGLSDSAVFLSLVVDEGGEAAVRDLLPDLAGLTRSAGFRAPEEGLSCVTGIGSDLWDRLFGGPRPAQLHPLPVFAGATHTAPSTPGDLLLHIRAGRLHMCFELARFVADRLRGAAHVVDEVHGFRYFDQRDLLGFVDGTENPTGADAAAAVLVGDEDPDFRAGSYVVVQKYVHDMDAWNALSVEAQEMTIGRRKLDDLEIPEGVRPPDSHLTANVIEDENGDERQIVRDNMPFGTVGAGEFGTYFVGYAATPEVTELMLHRMFVGEPPGCHDRILDYSTPLTGGLFFVPSQTMLDDPPA